jgi:hypothetical protein
LRFNATIITTGLMARKYENVGRKKRSPAGKRGDLQAISYHLAREDLMVTGDSLGSTA